MLNSRIKELLDERMGEYVVNNAEDAINEYIANIDIEDYIDKDTFTDLVGKAVDAEIEEYVERYLEDAVNNYM